MNLPDPLAGYFAAANSDDTDGILSFFAEDAAVEGEKLDHLAHAAIRRWLTQTRETYGFHSEPFRLEGDARYPIGHAHVAGDFPDNPVDLVYRFEIADNLIKTLTIR